MQTKETPSKSAPRSTAMIINNSESDKDSEIRRDLYYLPTDLPAFISLRRIYCDFGSF